MVNLKHSLRAPFALVGLVIFVAGWQVPGHFPPWTSFQQQWLTAFGVCWIALAAGLDGHGELPWPAVALVPAALAAVPWVQWSFGQLPFLSDAVLPSLYVLGFAVTIAAAARLAQATRLQWTDQLMVALLSAASIGVALAALQWLQQPISELLLDQLPAGGRPYGNLSQANHLATLLGLGLASILYLYERRRIGAVGTVVAAAWLGFGLVMTQSRTAWLFIGLLLPWWLAGRHLLRVRWPAIAGGLVLFVAAVAAWAPLNGWLYLAEPLASFGERAHGDVRLGVWRALFEAILEAPWFGWGWNQVPVAQLSIAFDHDAGQRAFRNAHNLLLDLALWVGVPLALALLCLATYWLMRQMKRCNDGSTWAVILALGPIAVHALTEYPLDYAYFILTLALIVGTLQGLSPLGPVWLMPRWALLAPWSICVSVFLWTSVEYMKVENSTREVRFLLFGIGLDKVSYVPPPDTVLLDAWREYHRYMITPARRDMSDEQLIWVRHVAQRHPHPSALVRYALAMGLNGHGEESARVLRAICNLHDSKSCSRARELWKAAQAQYPELSAMP